MDKANKLTVLAKRTSNPVWLTGFEFGLKHRETHSAPQQPQLLNTQLYISGSSSKLTVVDGVVNFNFRNLEDVFVYQTFLKFSPDGIPGDLWVTLDFISGPFKVNLITKVTPNFISSPCVK